jgi:hypothetical protein
MWQGALARLAMMSELNDGRSEPAVMKILELMGLQGGTRCGLA